MNYIKCFLCLIFIVFNINSAFADTGPTQRSQQDNADICGQKNCEFIFKEMKRLAKNGSSMAQATVSMMYANGIGTQIDQVRSLKYIKKAANNGLPFAEYLLGMLYRKEKIVGKFGKDADYWLMRAAKANYKPAIDLLVSEHKIPPNKANDYQPVPFPAVTDEDMEVIVITADKFTLTTLYEQLRRDGHSNGYQLGSRIKGRGCSYISCKTIQINSDLGTFLLYLYFKS